MRILSFYFYGKIKFISGIFVENKPGNITIKILHIWVFKIFKTFKTFKRHDGIWKCGDKHEIHHCAE